MSQQTAAEWLKKELENYGSSVHLTLFWSTFDKLYEHSKQMEKEQIIKAFNEGTFSEMEKIDAEEYYNETYNK